jgi:hypothetical protein
MLTCQLVSTGRPVMVILYGVRRGRGGGRSLGWYGSRREPLANCTMRRSPMNWVPSVTLKRLSQLKRRTEI